jgi:hypothetical protein
VGAAHVVQTLSFEFTDDVCDGESTRRAPQRSIITAIAQPSPLSTTDHQRHGPQKESHEAVHNEAAANSSTRQQQLQTPPDEPERYWQMPFMSTAEWETRYSFNALLWGAETGRIIFPPLAMMAKDYYSTQRKSS